MITFFNDSHRECEGFNLNLPLPASCASARWFEALGLPTVFVLEGGYAAAALGIHAVNAIEGF
jgi:acetoin utilization deacetylase AcuC-like enzyme